ncbi:MAG: DinB family protein [Flavisolibacter sp.]
MKEILLPYASYHLWANQQLIATIENLPPGLAEAEVKSSFSSLAKTLLHMWDAESIWWQRLKLQEKITRPSDEFRGTAPQIGQSLLQQDKQWLDWIAQAQERSLQHEFIYQNTKKEMFKQPVWQMLLHLFNHGTYHRGQVVTMLRQLDVSKIPATDYIVFSRKK